MKLKKHLKTTVYKFVHKSMVDIYAATRSIKPWNILFDTDRYNIKYNVYINGEKLGGFITLIDIDNDHYGYYELFYYNNDDVCFKTINNTAKIKLKRIKRTKLPI